MKYILLFSLFFLLHTGLNAQTETAYVKDTLKNSKENSNNIELTTSYTVHSSYAGRDNGFNYNYIYPTITYYHKSGFSLSGTVYYLTGKGNKLSFDGGDIGVGFEYVFSHVFTGSIGYSHSFFADSSKQAKSVTPDSFNGGLSASFGGFNFELNADIDIGTKSEYIINFIPSYQFELGPIFNDDDLSIEPAFLFIWGSQNDALTRLRRQKAKANGIPLSTAKQSGYSFGILSYEPTLSVNYENGIFTLKPTLSYVIPQNVNDQSNTNGFINLNIDFSITIN